MIHSKVTTDMGSTLGALKLQVAVGGTEEDLSMSRSWAEARGPTEQALACALGPAV